MIDDDLKRALLAAYPQFTEDDFKNPGWDLVDAMGAYADALAEWTATANPISLLKQPMDLAFAPRMPGESLTEFRLRTGLRSDK
jgi:hypothetical protein